MLAALLLLPAQEKDSFFPAKEGSVRTFRTNVSSYGGKEFTHRYEKVGKRVFTLVEANPEDVKSMKVREATAGADDLLVLEGEQMLFVVRKTKDEVRVYRHAWGEEFSLTYVFPTELKAGLKWTSPHVYPSCGWFVAELEYAATEEKVTVPAGTFDAVRVAIGKRWRQSPEATPTETIWFARGQGIVKWTNNRGTHELVK